MKKVIGLLFVLLFLSACGHQGESAFDIMVKAKQENRELTSKEVSIVEKEVNVISWGEKSDYEKSLGAMYMNFYADDKFYEAKESAENSN